MIALTLAGGNRILVNPNAIQLICERRDHNGVYYAEVYLPQCRLKVTTSFEDLAEQLGCLGVAVPVQSLVAPDAIKRSLTVDTPADEA